MLIPTTVLTNTVPSTDGWVGAGETWTYGAADDPTYAFTIVGDLTGKYSPGMRVRVSQATGGTKYFIVTNVEFAGGMTTVTVYGGTDYDLNNETISSPYYSVVKAPVGFPLDPTKWTVSLADSSRRSQSSPSANTWYQPGSLAITVPIGAWNVQVRCLEGQDRGSANYTDNQVALSTSTSSISDDELSYLTFGANLTNRVGYVALDKQLVLAAKTTYNLILRTTTASASAIYFYGDFAPTRVRAVCAYL